MVVDWVAEFVKGRVCHGPSLLWAEMSWNQVNKYPYIRCIQTSPKPENTLISPR